MAFAIFRCPACSATTPPETKTCGYCGAPVRFQPAPGQAALADAAMTGWVAEARAELAAGRRIDAIKAVRTGTGLGLREAKDLVDDGSLGDDAKMTALAAQPPRPAKASCFPAHVRIATPTGLQAIATLAPGDRVLSWTGGGVVVRALTRVVRHASAVLWEVRLAGRQAPLETTGHHSFLTARGWRRTDRLRAGDVLLGPSAARVEAARATPRRAAVYNLHTTGEHSFIAEGVVAHNFTTLRRLRTLWHRAFCDRGPGVPASGSRGPASNTEEAPWRP